MHAVRRALRRSKRIKSIARWKRTYFNRDTPAQWLWWALGIPKERVAFGEGLLTWRREAKNRRLRRSIHIAFVDGHTRHIFTRLNALWINTNSNICSASVNDRISEADIVWVSVQDPIQDGALKQRLLRQLAAAPGAKVVNPLDRYNAYHQLEIFPQLQAAGVNVPRFTFSEADVGKTEVVYKMMGRQTCEKTRELWQGEREGYRPFAFVDSRNADGLYRRYRAYYIFGLIRSHELMLGEHWNVNSPTKPKSEFWFETTEQEGRQIEKIAAVTGLNVFAVDFLRRKEDESPCFVDINVFPDVQEKRKIAPGRRDFGIWHTFDTRPRLELAEPAGVPFPELFDEAVLAFYEGRRHFRVS